MSEHRVRTKLNVASGISVVLLIITLGLCLLSHWIADPQKQRISLGPNLYITVEEGFFNGDAIGHIVVFNDDNDGPYRGSMLFVDTPPQHFVERRFDAWGIYYRYFELNQNVLWTFRISLWYALILFSVAPVVWLIRRRLEVAGPGLCPKCRYDIRASSGNCPECGAQLRSDSEP